MVATLKLNHPVRLRVLAAMRGKGGVYPSGIIYRRQVVSAGSVYKMTLLILSFAILVSNFSKTEKHSMSLA